MQLETKNLLENYRNSCYLECGGVFGQKAGRQSLQVWPGSVAALVRRARREFQSAKTQILR
jgi:hypothetical protein